MTESITRGSVRALTPPELETLRATLGAIVVTPQTTELQAGYMLGVQRVINLLETGIHVQHSR